MDFNFIDWVAFVKKDCSMRFFGLVFFHESTPNRSLMNIKKLFNIFSRIHGDIRAWSLTSAESQNHGLHYLQFRGCVCLSWRLTSMDRPTHLTHLETQFTAFAANGLTINFKKGNFPVPSLHILGHVRPPRQSTPQQSLLAPHPLGTSNNGSIFFAW
jgi:hypothetical protein